MTRLLFLPLLSALCLLAGAGSAQPVPLATPPAFNTDAGVKIGDFALRGQADAGMKATSNIRQDPSEESDFEYQLLAMAALRSTWQEHALALAGTYVRHRGLKVEDQLSEALSGSVSGRYDFSPAWNLTLGVKQDETIVGRSNPLQFIGNLNGTTSIRTAEAALGWRGQKHFVNVLSRIYEVENETKIDVTDASLLQAQNTEEIDVTVEVGQNFSWGKAQAFGGITDIEYTGSESILPFNRDSFGFRIGLSVEGMRGKWSGQARIIGIFQDFNNPMIGKNNNVAGRVLAMYQATQKLGLGIAAQRQFDDINILPTSAGLFTNTASVALQYSIRDDLYVKLGPSVNFYQIHNTALQALSWTGDASVNWQVHPRARLTLAGSLFTQSANDDLLSNVEYDENDITLTATFSF